MKPHQHWVGHTQVGSLKLFLSLSRTEGVETTTREKKRNKHSRIEGGEGKRGWEMGCRKEKTTLTTAQLTTGQSSCSKRT